MIFISITADSEHCAKCGTVLARGFAQQSVTPYSPGSASGIFDQQAHLILTLLCASCGHERRVVFTGEMQDSEERQKE